MQWTQRQPGDPRNAPNKSGGGGEQLFAPPCCSAPPQEPFGPCWPAARAASTETEDWESDRRALEQTPIRRKPSTATELWPSALASRAHKSSTNAASSSATASRLASSVGRPGTTEPSSLLSVLFSPPSTPRTKTRGPLRPNVFSSSPVSPPPSASSFSSASSAGNKMMEVNVVPSVVLHFHGFRSSLLSNLGDAALRIALDMAQRSLYVTSAAVAAYLFKLLLEAALRKLALALVVYAAFLACEALAVKHGKKPSLFLLGAAPATAMAVTVSAPVPAPPQKLPRLNLPTSIAMLPCAPTDDDAAATATKLKQIDGDAAQLAPTILATPQPARQLSAVRRRLVAQLRTPFPGVNVVPRERRRRADVVLHEAKIRVGKAFLDPIVSAAIASGAAKSRKQVDTYMVRVDSSTPDDKHMNPVVMWDFTATFEEFRTLEKDLRAEIKAKRLRNVTVPHLSSGAILFVQPELTQDVLAKRRLRLQAFMDALRNDRVLADSDAMRKFCQAF